MTKEIETIVECPICAAKINENQINAHLDSGCKVTTKGDSVSKSQSTIDCIPAKSNQTHTLGIKRKRSASVDIKAKPLAELSRPTEWKDILFENTKDLELLRVMIENQKIQSLILFGPPGCGKTTLARIIGRQVSWYREFSATIHSIQDIKAAGIDAVKHLKQSGKKGVIFLDEIHRFNKAQQDIFLSPVERGDYILIGATTENPSFRINNALLSRCRVFLFEKLKFESLVHIMRRSIDSYTKKNIPNECVDYIARLSDGDARYALNTLEMLINTCPEGQTATIELAKDCLSKSHLIYDRNGEEHYNIISALHKSLRGSNANAAIYWLGRMIYAGEDPLYVARRLVRFASEDIGLADNNALPLALSTYQACQVIGMPECDAILSHCVTYLARAPKSVESYQAIKKVKSCIQSERNYPVPLHLRNAPTTLMDNMNYGHGYKYNPDYAQPIEQDYLPPELQDIDFFDFQPS
ncbi:Werner helicase interacting protein 1, partial [Globomyces sp. JEL0801]